jgi:hypothetical protein
MIPNTAQLFREGKTELLKLFGNRYLVFDTHKIQLPDTFVGLMTTRNYKDFQRKLITTMDDVSYIREGYYVAHNKEPETKMKSFGTENHYVQDELVDTTIYLTSEFDPIHIQVQSL